MKPRKPPKPRFFQIFIFGVSVPTPSRSWPNVASKCGPTVYRDRRIRLCITTHNHAKMTDVGNFWGSCTHALDRSAPNLARLGTPMVYMYPPTFVRLGITGSAVALHCCKAHSKSIEKMENSTPCKTVTPENLILKLGTRDYVENMTHYTNFHVHRFSGGFFTNR